METETLFSWFSGEAGVLKGILLLLKAHSHTVVARFEINSNDPHGDKDTMLMIQCVFRGTVLAKHTHVQQLLG